MANRLILNETSYHGKGAIQNIVHEVTSRSFKKALVVTDKDLIKFNVAQKVTSLLDTAGLPYEIFDEVKANPAVDVIKAGVAKFKASSADYLIAIGGGSPIDSAKAIGIIINNPEFSDVLSLEGVAPTHQKCVPIIAIPTTTGTAAEVTINYVITDEAKKRKFVCVDVHDVPAVALVDPDMMESMPKSLAAATGMDALTHAIEGYITKAAWELTDALHLKAIELIGRSLRGAVEKNPKDVEAMALGQYVAGMGFSNVGLGVVHSMAHPLSAYYDTPHGIANAVLLPYVMEFNKNYTGEKYREIARAMGVKGVDEMSQEEYRNAAIAAVQQLSKDVGIPPKLHQIGVKEADLPALSVDAFNDVCTSGNPRDCTAEELLEVYRIAY
ncbi:lactaldehyde reductase [Mannheimia pernigra]|uniref:lactaldehyde reductase n=1 Tax=Mannheimia pernigra TaxID=111844 RepID=UPI001315C4F9|nr:lactaldehyde reductase [Mannheimia pernigra]QHB16978.1 lactaldehyde reductase [Mannheimia pernigra]